MANPLENNLLLYFLAGAGRSIGGEGSTGDILGGMAQQNIAAQSQAKANKKYIGLLRDMLSGGGKITVDKDNLNIKAPTSALGGGGNNNSLKSSQLPDFLGELNLNPSVSPVDFSGADLAGLTPENVSQALAGGINVNKILESKISDIAGQQLKSRELDILQNYRQTESTTNRIKAITNLAKQFRSAPLDVPGLGSVSLDQWNALDTKTKAYSYYAYDAKQNGEQVMPFNEWSQQTPDPIAYQLYEEATKDPEFNKWLTKYRKAGATRISLGEKVEQREAFADVDAKKYFTDPKGLAKDVDKYISSDEMKYKLFQFEGREKDIETVKAKEKFVDNKITSAGGQILDKRLSGRTFVWKVKWPDGSTSEVKYAN